MPDQNRKIRIAAVADIHIRESDKGKWTNYFKVVSGQADILLLCGDLTDNGKITEAEILCEELSECTIPVVGVLGNHDYDHGHEGEIKDILRKKNVIILDGEFVVIGEIGFAGVKGFAGGFDKFMLCELGENTIKVFVETAIDEALRLDRALALMDADYPDIKKIVVTHYAPIKATVIGEPEEIFPFLGSSRLAEPINSRKVMAAFHGHAHMGTLKGLTSKGIEVFNVSKATLLRAGYDIPFYIFEA
jgi:Icc-related predicted phosphoesterase